MSHVVGVDIQIKNIEALKAACHNLGLTFKENQKTHRWYGRWVNDYDAQNAAYKHGIKPEDYGKCLHAIEVKGSDYDIGVVAHPSGVGYSLVWDFWGTGQKINQAIGSNAEKLKQHYGLAMAKITARHQSMVTGKGYMCTQSTLPNGSIKLKVEVYG